MGVVSTVCHTHTESVAWKLNNKYKNNKSFFKFSLTFSLVVSEETTHAKKLFCYLFSCSLNVAGFFFYYAAKAALQK